MKYSFLYRKEPMPGNIGNSITDFSIDQIVRYIQPNISKRDYILNILSGFETDIDNIKWRQGLINDFINEPLLLKKLQQHFEQLEQINSEYSKFKKDLAQFKSTNSNNYDLDSTISMTLLKDVSEIVLRTMKLYNNIFFILDSYNNSSEALKVLKRFLEGELTTDAFKKISIIISNILSNNTFCPKYHLIFDLDERLQLTGGHFAASLEPVVDDNMKGFFKRNRKSKEHITEKSIPVNKRTSGLSNHLLTFASTELINIFLDVYNHFYEPFSNVFKELPFYEFAYNYYLLIKDIKLPICIPELNTMNNRKLICDDLCDILIGIKSKKDFGNTIKVIPNDVDIHEKYSGIMIKGNNGTGKTVYLRSIGIAQIFAQTGLPIAAKTAQISIKSGLFTLFSSQEINEANGGRFEQEVQMLSKIIKQIDKHSLILVNEIFQSTSTNDGESAMLDILSYFSKLGSLWIVVTHLQGLFNKIEEFKLNTNNNEFIKMESYNNDAINKYKLYRL